MDDDKNPPFQADPNRNPFSREAQAGLEEASTIMRLQSALTAMERERDEAMARCVALRDSLGDMTAICSRAAPQHDLAIGRARQVLADTADMAGMVVVSQDVWEAARWVAQWPEGTFAVMGLPADHINVLKRRVEACRSMLAASTGESGRG
jgi:hypothetical protein